MLAEFEIVPIGTKSAGVSKQLAVVADLIDTSGLDYRLGPMGTVVEGSWDDVLALAKRCHEALLGVSDRVMTTIRIDDRRDKQGPRMAQKVQSLEQAVGRVLKR